MRSQVVFISWSGKESKRIASLLRTVLQDILTSSEAFVSDEDISKGNRWSEVLQEKLSSAVCGIVCVTPDNFKSPWLLYEAGALANSVGASEAVCPLLIGLDKSAIGPPLAQHQMTSTDKDDFFKLVKSINNHLDSEHRSSDEDIARRFKRVWPEIESWLTFQPENPSAVPPPERRPEEILNEILDRVRSIERADRTPLSHIYGASAIASAESKEDYHGPLAPGMDIISPIFGVGRVLSIKGHGERETVTVFFPSVGRKILKRKFARLQILIDDESDDELES